MRGGIESMIKSRVSQTQSRGLDLHRWQRGLENLFFFALNFGLVRT